MDTLEFLTFFFFFLPHIAAKKCHESRCQTNNSPVVRFPFRLGDRQAQRCGYSSDFDLSCNQQKHTILTLPSSPRTFTVQSISYADQIVWINDLNNCTAKRFLEHDFSLVGSPFRFEHNLENYTFFNCSPQAPVPVWQLYRYQRIACLSSDEYTVIALPTSSWNNSPLSNCTMISTAMVPDVTYEWLDSDFSVTLTWGSPDCRSCESLGHVCGFKDSSMSQLDCSIPTYGRSKAATFRLIVSVGLPGLVCVVLFALYIFNLIRDDSRIDEAITELSGTDRTISVTSPPQIHHVALTTGLDDMSIESYSKTQLGEKWEYPNSEDSTCAICLCEYQSKETIRTIPECHHHFHAGCIDEWLRKHPTCPVCRKITPSPSPRLRHG